MDELPTEWLYITLTEIKQAQTKTSDEMRAGFQSLWTAHTTRELASGKLEARILALEKLNDESSWVWRTTQTALVSAGLFAAWEGLKHLMGWK